MVMRRDSFSASMEEHQIGGLRFADPIHRPLGPVAQPGDPNAALLAAISQLNGNILDLKTLIGSLGSGGGGDSPAGGCVPAYGQAVEFLTVPLTAALDRFEVTIPACYSFCQVFSDGSTEGISIRQTSHSGAVIDLGRYTGFPLLKATTKLYITADVEPGRTVLVLGLSYGIPLHLATQRQIVSATVYDAAIVAAGTFQSTWFNWTNGRLLIDVVSTLDAVCTIQAVGNIDDDWTTAKDIGAALNCPIGSIVTSGLDIGLADDDWHPYIAIEIVTPGAPTAGTLTIKVLQLSEGGDR